MISEGQIVLFRFPQTDQQPGKLRPALIVRRLPGQYEDWLISMVSSQLNQEISGFDEVILPEDPDFKDSGLKLASLHRLLVPISSKPLIKARPPRFERGTFGSGVPGLS